MMNLNVGLIEKLDRLRDILAEMGSLVLGVSGGVDSVFLAVIAHEVLGTRALAVTADSPSMPRRELLEAQRLANVFGFHHLVIQTQEMSLPTYSSNPVNRCYFCKNELFDQLVQIAHNGAFRWVCYGENLDDRTDHRPGGISAREHLVRAPLKEAGFSKADIRTIAREIGLPIWDKPAMACLSSRIPYGSHITPEKLNQVETAENYLADLGFRQCRVRHHGEIARIEVEPAEMLNLMMVGNEINDYLKKLGFTFVAVDLAGYRRGSLNEGQQLISLNALKKQAEAEVVL
jgi:uncharacterized protein